MDVPGCKMMIQTQIRNITIATILKMWIVLSILNQVMLFTDGKVTISNDGSYSTECCVDGVCHCNSLTYALQSVNSDDIIIEIISESVTLANTSIGLDLHSITITGNGTTIMCNNSGGVYCKSCSDVIIEGIIWDQCIHTFNACRINITNCVFWHFKEIYIFDMDDCSTDQELYLYNDQFNGKEDDITKKCAVIAMIQGNGVASIYNSTFICAVVNVVTFQNTHTLNASSSVFGNCSQLHIHAIGGHRSNIILQYMIFQDNYYNESTVFISSNSTTLSCSIIESRFINNNNTALELSIGSGTVSLTNCLFENNSADYGAAIKSKQIGQDVCMKLQDTKFAYNAAKYYGGAIYYSKYWQSYYPRVRLDFLGGDSAIFVNNSAGSAGNNIYISDPDYHSIDYFRQYYGETDGLPPAPVSPYHVCLYSPIWASCYHSKVNCDFGRIMLGEPINFRAAVCDYYDRTIVGTELQLSCTNCTEYKPAINPIIFENVTESHSIIFRHNKDIHDQCDYNCTLNFVVTPQNVNPHEFNKSKATVTVELSPCFSGFVFKNDSQKCECFFDGDHDNDNDVVKCNGDFAEIRGGYWFGIVKEKRTVSLCPNLYCDFSTFLRIDTGNGFYSLPRRLDDQCFFKTGRACGECYPGDALAYNIPVCVSENKCTWISAMAVVMLTFFYWIIIVVGACGLMHTKVQLSLGSLYGIIYYYSTVDVLLGNNLNIHFIVLGLVALISTFTKLTPILIGSLCFVRGFSGIDQQFINYIHVVAVILILFGISRAAKYSRRLANFGKNFVIRTVCVLLLLSYTSLASTSLQLLRPLKFHKVDGIYSYSSPDMKYFTGRHALYGVVAILCLAVFVIGFPCLLLFESLLSRKINFIRIKPLLDQFQGSYKDKYRWFAAYYLICRLVIFIIVYTIDNYQYRLYCLQTVCVLIAMIHGWIQPYKNGLLNISDATILLNMVLVVGLSAFSFQKNVTAMISIVLLIFPICLLCILIIAKKRKLCYWMLKWKKTHHNNSDMIALVDNGDQPVVRSSEVCIADDRVNQFQEPLLMYED